MPNDPKSSKRPPVKVPRRPTPEADIPRVISEATRDEHLEIITRAIFQAGLSWSMIAGRWDAFRTAFEDFDARLVAAYGEFDLDRIMHADGVIHSAKKISGTFANARTILDLEQEFGSIAAYVAAHASYTALFADAHRRFAFMGDLSCYYWLFRTAAPVPVFEDWIARQAQDHPRMREMVEQARAAGASSERAGF